MDESGLNLSMTRSHAWVKKGTEFTERTPMRRQQRATRFGSFPPLSCDRWAWVPEG
jgi:hypothetical protein